MLTSRSTPKDVEANFKPLINFCMDLIVFPAQLLWADFLFKSLGLCSSAIFVGTANIECRSASSFIISRNGQK
jgi:hypothetical protein